MYKTKGGVEVRALDDVSLRFADRGMVFLLGKSGSGKSTLLNLCGGLDAPDSGEIVIKGRSSKDFAASDFDSYRNTFVGFIFQEYNILSEFTVEDNIALALELQGKNKDKEKVAEILRKVDLEAFAKRKPNTLSGGQKQRVAIARALVKDPEIIMADEPTGALDSGTGKQVFETLKNLSKDKLVIVVSHDREFAEIYGDRIIELKDGKIISDVTKNKVASTPCGDNISFIGGDTISVKNGAELSEKEKALILKFLTTAKSDVIIAGGEKEVSDYKKAARIDESGARECFRETDVQALVTPQYSPEDGRFVRSKLPARHAVRIGASSMKVKPFRLFFTIFLSFIAFTMFGLFSTLTFYDKQNVAAQSYIQAGYTGLTFQKRYTGTQIYEVNGKVESSYSMTNNTKFTPDELKAYTQKYGTALGVYGMEGEISNASRKKTSSYYSAKLYSVVQIPAGNGNLWQMVTDTDLSALGGNDIVISTFLYDSLQYFGLFGANNQEIVLPVGNYNEIVGKTLTVSSNYSGTPVDLTVKGVYRLDLPEKYNALKDGQVDYTLQYAYENELRGGQYLSLLVGETFYEENRNLFGNNGNGDYYKDWQSLRETLTFESPKSEGGDTESIAPQLNGYIYNIAPLNEDTSDKPDTLHYFQSGKNYVSENEIILSFSNFNDYFWRLSDAKAQKIYEQKYNEVFTQTNDWEAANKAATQERQTAFEQLEQYREFLANGYYRQWIPAEDDSGLGTESYTYPTDTDYENALTAMLALHEENGADWGTIDLLLNSGESLGTFTPVGFFYGSFSGNNNSAAFFGQSDFDRIYAVAGNGDLWKSYFQTKYVESPDAVFNYIIIAFPERNLLNQILAGENVFAQDDSCYVLVSAVSDQLATVNGMIGIFEKVFLWVGVVMALFSMLLMFNFISVSISYKKKDIGILRAVGARSVDVFKIFYSESAIIAGICFVLALIVSFILCGVLNKLMAAELGVAIFVLGPLSILIMLGIAVVSSFIATFLPVYGIARRKPVESIRAL